MANVSGGNSFLISYHWVYKLLKAERMERDDQKEIEGEIRKMESERSDGTEGTSAA